MSEIFDEWKFKNIIHRMFSFDDADFGRAKMQLIQSHEQLRSDLAAANAMNEELKSELESNDARIAELEQIAKISMDISDEFELVIKHMPNYKSTSMAKNILEMICRVRKHWKAEKR